MKNHRILLAAVAFYWLAALTAAPVFAQDEVPSLEEMWKIIQRQQAEIDALREENESLRESMTQPLPEGTIVEVQPMDPEVALEPEPEKADRFEFGETVLDLYGHAMLDMGYQANQNDPDWFDVVRPTKLPSFEDEFAPDGNFFIGVRQSRFGVQTRTPTQHGDLKTWFEFELFGVGADAGQTTFRLRHAWGELGQFGFGQTDSVFMDMSVFPNSIEYWGPSGMILYRNIQARWTPWSTDNGSRFAVSLEQPGGSGDRGQFDEFERLDGIEGNFRLPDLAAHYRHVGDWGHVQAAGIVRQIRWKDTMPGLADLSDEVTGWGLNLSTNINIGPHVFRGSVTYGESIQNYFNDSTADVGLALAPGRPELPIVGEQIPVLGLVAFLDLNWSDTWTSTIGYSIQDNDLPELSAQTSFERGQYALANILYHPLPNVYMGPEIQWAKRDNFGPFSSDDLRVQFSAKYAFSKTFGGR